MTIGSRYAVTCEVDDGSLGLLFDPNANQQVRQGVIEKMGPAYGLTNVVVAIIQGENGNGRKLSLITEPNYEGKKFRNYLVKTTKRVLKEFKNKN